MSSGSGTWISQGLVSPRGIFKMDHSLASVHSLSYSDSGKTFLVHSTYVRTINLPDMGDDAKAAYYKFIVTNSTVASTIVADGAYFKGGILLDTAYGSLAGTTITIKTNAIVGDWLSLISDGSYWYVSGQSGSADGFGVV